MTKLTIPRDALNNLDANLWQSNEALGTIILIPGYLDSHYYHAQLAKELSMLGWNVIGFDPHGLWGSDGNLSNYHIPSMLADISAVITWINRHQTINKTILLGHSLGGLVASTYGARHPDEVSGIITLMSPLFLSTFRKPFFAWKWFWRGERTSKRPHPISGEKTTITVPFSFLLKSLPFKALKELKKCSLPLLAVVGSEDTVVSPQWLQNWKKYSHTTYFEYASPHHPIVNEELINIIAKWLRKSGIAS